MIIQTEFKQLVIKFSKLLNEYTNVCKQSVINPLQENTNDFY